MIFTALINDKDENTWEVECEIGGTVINDRDKYGHPYSTVDPLYIEDISMIKFNDEPSTMYFKDLDELKKSDKFTDIEIKELTGEAELYFLENYDNKECGHDKAL